MRKRPTSVSRKSSGSKKTPLRGNASRTGSKRSRMDEVPKEPPAAQVETSERLLPSDPVELQPVRFGYFNSEAHEVFVAGSFNNWNPRATPMKRDTFGDWSVEVQLPPGEYHYRLLVDGEWRDDPSAQLTAMNSYGGFDAVVIV